MAADFDLQTYLGTDPCPQDFEAFWNRQMEALSGLEIPYELKDADYQIPGHKCCDLYYHSFDSSRIHCKNSSKSFGCLERIVSMSSIIFPRMVSLFG